MDVSMMLRMKEFEDENRRLKKMYFEAKLKAKSEALGKSGEAISQAEDGQKSNNRARCMQLQTSVCTASTRMLEFNLRINPRKRLLPEKPEVLTVPQGINQVWSMDFMHDQLEDGRMFWLLNVIDDFNREVIGMEMDFSIPSERVIRELK